jgi:NAD(P)-dependent dehydrogenase (short-subunit alcohol dehydrogenase family)
MDKVLIVTGAQGTLGRAVSEAARAAGFRLAMLDAAAPDGGRREDGVLEIGGIDLADPDAALAAVDQVRAVFGRVDGVANVAGGFIWRTVEAADVEAWRRMFAMNVLTAAAVARAAIPLLRQSRGAIVNVAAAAAQRAGAGFAPYAASKAGVLRLTEALAEELKDDGVRVNAVSPTIIDTPANRRDMPDADPSAWVAPADLANVILFLLSDAARAVTGAQIVVGARA